MKLPEGEQIIQVIATHDHPARIYVATTKLLYELFHNGYGELVLRPIKFLPFVDSASSKRPPANS